MDLRDGHVAAPGRPLAVNHRDHIAEAHPVADLDAQFGDRTGNPRRHVAALARHQAADHGEGLAQRFAGNRIDLNLSRRVLGPGGARQDAGNQRQGHWERS